MDRSLSPTGALLNLFCGMLGPGFLSIPFAFKMAGLWTGLGLVFVVGGVCLLSMYRLVECSQFLTRKSPAMNCLSYGDTVEAALQSRFDVPWVSTLGRYTADGCVAAFQLGVLVVSFVFVSEHLPQILEPLGIEKPSHTLPLYLILQIALCYSASMKILTILASLGNFAVLAVFFIVSKEMFSRGLHSPDSLPAVTDIGGIATAAGAIIYALEGQTMVLPLENRLNQRKSMLGISGVLCTAIHLVILMYAATGFFGFLCFGYAIRGSISLNLPPNTFSRIVQILLVGKIFVGTALQLHVFMDVFCPPGRGKAVSKIVGPVVLISTALFAMCVPHLSLVIPLIGLTSGLALSLFFPPLLHLILLNSLYTDSSFYSRVISAIIDFSMIFVGVYFLLTGLFEHFSKFPQRVGRLKNMSKFFQQGSSDSSSESSDDEVQEVVQQVKKPLVGRDFNFPSDSEDEEKRVVRAHKDKKFDEIKDKVKNIRNSKNNRDLSRLQSDFDDMLRTYDKSKTIFARQNVLMPRFYVRCIVELEDYINAIWEDKEAKNALSKVNAKALPALRQKVRKYAKENEQKVTEYRENADPVGYESPEDEEDETFGSDESPKHVPKPADKKKKPAADSESEMDSDWTDDESSESSDSDMDFDTRKMEDLRRYFLKKEFRADDGGNVADDKKAERKKKREEREKRVLENLVDDDDDEGEWTPITKEKQVQLFEPKQEVTHDVMIAKIEEITASRGRLGTNRKHHVRLLQELYKIAEEKDLGVGILVKLNFDIVSSLFELNTKISDFMEYGNFTKTLVAIGQLLDMLIEHREKLSMSVKYTEEDENLKDATQHYKVRGSFLMIVQRLDSELTKILQNADCHSNDYIEKLKGEKDMCLLIERTEKYVEDNREKDIFELSEICKVYMMHIEHLYYKYQDHHDGAEPVGSIMDRLCKKIYALDEEKRLRQRAMLCHIYWLALHDEWHRARDMMLMSHLQAIVDHSDTDTQILYNRAICQLGLCAFRHGFIKEAHLGLSEIQNTQRAKELLAQSVAMRQHERTAEQEKAERQRQVPYHMHVNVELMECVYLICSMLLEIPHMASCEFEMRRRLLSRSFHYQLKQSEKASLVGPPENTREHVVAASRAMLAGDWRKCRDYIVNEKMNQKVWNLFRNADSVKNMVIRRIQEESLRTYLLMYSTVYTTVSLTKLATLFELDKKQIHSVISKMIIQEELSATLDEPTDCLIMHRVEPSRLQMLALNLTDKLQMLAENNEQILEPRTGRAGYSGPGAWYPGRERQGDKQKAGSANFQGDRRTGQSDGKRSNAWGQQNNSQRRRERDSQKRF